jgi:hypothetical protein
MCGRLSTLVSKIVRGIKENKSTKNRKGSARKTFPNQRRRGEYFWKEFGTLRNNVNITYFLSVSIIV